MNSSYHRSHPFQSTGQTHHSVAQRAHGAARLSREEERELIARWQSHRDKKAAEKLTACSMRFVVAVANRHRRYNVPLDVLISEGSLGLVRAMEKFDLAQETRFSTYATYWIRFYVIDHIMRTWSIVGGGSGALKTRLFFRLRRERARAWSLYGNTDTADQVVADRLGLTRKELTRMARQLDQRDLSLNVPMREDSSMTLLDTLPTEADQVQRIERAEALQKLKPVLAEALGTLNARERAIVEHRLMAYDEDEQSLSKLGESFGVSRERVRQIEDGLKTKLRNFISQRCCIDDMVAA
jgi:RNA polymerase sigma-32 factor